MKEFKTLLAAALAALFLTVPVWADDDDDDDNRYNKVVPYGTQKLAVDIWVDKGKDASYYPGEDIRVFFRANQDAYVMLYNVDTQGKVSLLFPYDYRDHRLVQGDRPVPVPGGGDDYYLKVNGPAGIEMVVAVVSREPFPIPDLGWNSDLEDLRAEDYYYMHRAEGEDIWDFVERLNRRLVPAHVDYELDVETFTVQQRYQRDYYVDPGFYFSYYRYPHYYPDWYFGSVYFDYPYRSAVYIDGIFFGWTPLFMPRFLYGHYYVTIYNQGCLVYRDYVDHHRGRRNYTIHVPPDRVYKSYYRKNHDDYTVIKEKPDVYWTKVRDNRLYVQKNQAGLKSSEAGRNAVGKDIRLGKSIKGEPKTRTDAPVSKEKQMKENFLSMRDQLKSNSSQAGDRNSDNFSREAVLEKSDLGKTKLDRFKSGQPTNAEKSRSVIGTETEDLGSDAVRKTDKLRQTKSSNGEKEETKSETPGRTLKTNVAKPKVAEPKADQPKTERSKATEPKSDDSKVERFKDDKLELKKKDAAKTKSERPDGSQSRLDRSKMDTSKLDNFKLEKSKSDKSKSDKSRLDKSKLDKFRNSERVVASSGSSRYESSPSKVKSSGTVESRTAQSKTALSNSSKIKTDKFRSARSTGNGEQKSVRSQASQPTTKSVRKSDASRKTGAPAVKETARAKSSDSRVSMPSGSVRGSSGKSGQKSPRPRN